MAQPSQISQNIDFCWDPVIQQYCYLEITSNDNVENSKSDFAYKKSPLWNNNIEK